MPGAHDYDTNDTHESIDTMLISFVADSYETSDMLMEWDEAHGVELDDELQLPQFRLVDTKTSHCVRHYKTGSTQ